MNKKKEIKNKKKSIRVRLISAIVLLATIPLVAMCLLITQLSENVIRENSKKLALEMLKQTSVNVNYCVEQIETSIDNVGNNITITSGLVATMYSEDELKSYDAERSITQQLTAIPTTDKSIKGVTMLLAEGETYGASLAIDEELIWSDEQLQTSNEYIWQYLIEGENEKYIVMKHFPYQFSKSTVKDKKVIFVANVSVNKIMSNLASIELMEQSKLYLATQTGQIIYISDENTMQIPDEVWGIMNGDEETGSGITDNKQLVYYSRLNNGWLLGMEIPEQVLTKDLEDVFLYIIISLAVLVVVAIVVGTMISRSVTKPVGTLMNAMRVAEEGNLTSTVKIKGNNEFSVLGKSYNKMLENMKELMEDADNQVEKTKNESEQLHNIAKHSVSEFAQLSSSIAEISQGCNNQAEDAQQAMRTMTELSDGIEQVVFRSDDIYNTNEEAKMQMNVVAESMKELTTSVEESLDTAYKSNEKIRELIELTGTISSIMNLVEDIGEETNLLSLNASIEAARAGEAGKGFAVVAEQVRKLAEESKIATIDVRERLAQISDRTEEVIQYMDKSSSIFANQKNIMDNTNSLFGDIQNQLLVMSQKLEDIKLYTGNMKKNKDEMDERMENIASVTQQVAASTQQVNSLSMAQSSVMTDLSQLADRLKEFMNELTESIAKFYIGD